MQSLSSVHFLKFDKDIFFSYWSAECIAGSLCFKMAALLKVFASYVRENSVKRRGSTAGFREMNYCPETVLVHSAFLLAETVQKLDEIEKDKCSQVVKIVTGTVREITREVLHENTRKLRQIEVREIEFKIHSWVFYSLLKRSDCHDLGESLDEEDFFDSFPPLPQFGINFYLELVQELEWGELLVEVSENSIKYPNIFQVLTRQDVMRRYYQLI